MKKLSTLAVVLFVAALAFAAAPPRDEKVTVGSSVADFKLPDASGKEHTLGSLKGKNGTVLIFVATKCPVSNAYNARMEKLAQDYRAKGVNVVGINSNLSTSPSRA